MPNTNQTKSDVMSTNAEILLLQFKMYRRVVEKKHGLTVPTSNEAASNLSEEELQAYVDMLKDMAHLPPV